MRRRQFIAGLAIAAAWPLLAGAQQPAIPVVGFLRTTPSAPFAHLVAAFRRGLSDVGFVEGQNVAIEQRWTEGEDSQLPSLVTDLIRRKATVIVTNQPGALAAKAAGATIPSSSPPAPTRSTMVSSRALTGQGVT